MRFFPVLLLFLSLFLSAPFGSARRGPSNWQSTTYSDTIIGGLSVTGQDIFVVSESASAVKSVASSADMGKTWTYGNINNTAAFLFNIVMLSPTVGSMSGIAVAANGASWTEDGQNWHRAHGHAFLAEQVQSSQAINGLSNGVGLTGSFDKIGGVAISSDGGQTFQYFNASAASRCRYGAFPTASTWYVAAGQWPDNGILIDVDGKFHVSNRYSLRVPKHSGRTIHRSTPEELQPGMKINGVLVPGPNAWFGQILKTSDAGETWTSVFTNNTFYPNDIRFVSADVGFFVAENDRNAFIYRTQDGGQTWQQVLEDVGGSLLSAWASSPTDWFAGGGAQTQNLMGHIWYSADAGNTWTLSTIPGGYAMVLSMMSPSVGFAAGGNQQGASTVWVTGA